MHRLFIFLGDSLTYHKDQAFSTHDADNDANTNNNCAIIAKGAWWYNTCLNSNLNGQYLSGPTGTTFCVSWNYWLGHYYSLKETEMKIRPYGV